MCGFTTDYLYDLILQSVCESTFFKMYFSKNCPEGSFCGTFLKKGQKCTLSKVGFDQKVRYILSLCFIGLQRTEHLSEAERLCNGL